MNHINDIQFKLRDNVEQRKIRISKFGGNSHVSNQLNEMFKVQSIKYSDLKQPDSGKDIKRGENGNVIKKIYCGTEVACKRIPAVVDEDATDSQKIQTELSILSLLGKCDHIITFYGLTKVDKESTMVFAWATHGDLKIFYENHTLDWSLKLKFIRKIFKGLYFIHSNNILHNDIRCKNILVKDLTAKISGFEMSCSVQSNPLPIKNLSNSIYWMSPEIMKGMRYTYYSEMFSFGMLLWELYYERVPYKKMNVQEIQEYVINKGRETLYVFDSPIHKELTELIRRAWQDDPHERPSEVQVDEKLEELYKNHMHEYILPPVSIKKSQ
ncbi:10498_t:CDS:2 [Acaulospora morrowiae]|uniref:10498_t:CDS:1 n=1 Tax=Acaulospora morrowiae TaxID=94023 RepID=A0A9N9N6K8_9GLOM|nr:10498_t:CDS:2 [Acaulospora morrowiae]